jgi:hypothetical protein
VLTYAEEMENGGISDSESERSHRYAEVAVGPAGTPTARSKTK